jgi:isoleucyl-tRNA synthetase
LKNSKERKATQTVIFKLLKETTLLLAPILSFTTEEVWEHIPDFKGKTESVHLCKFPEIDMAFINHESKENWDVLMNIRDLVQKEIEAARSEKIIGDSLESEVTLTLPEKDFKIVSNNQPIFKNITVTSKVNIKSGKAIDISVKKFKGSKCPRCWNWFENSSDSTDNTTLCPRCNSVIKEI